MITTPQQPPKRNPAQQAKADSGLLFLALGTDLTAPSNALASSCCSFQHVPWAQANAYSGLLYLAGAIPLQPASMALVSGDVAGQALRALANCEAVAVGMRSSVFKAAVGAVVYWASGIGPAGKVRACARRGAQWGHMV